MTILAQTAGGAEEPITHSIMDNRVLDDFYIPFGNWGDQAVDWITLNLGWLLTIIEWPFSNLFDFLVDTVLEPVSWVWVVLFFFVLGTLVRNIKVGIFSAVALAVCGLLGNALWLETARTIGAISVAVLLCVIVGIPLGVACGRIDSLWKVVRPALDAMQVVHAFVYMLPFVFFWGIGFVSATMVTMIFALPPLVRLTNLGVRQVPGDVIEASRAYGAPEWRVLFDVQIPLARPAIMTGINQTLLLAISMLGIAALMGAGGLGQKLFNAVGRQDVAQGVSSGLAFFLVAVVLDRISQTESTDRGSLFRRMRLAWAHRKDPEALMPEVGKVEEDRQEGKFAELSKKEKPWMIMASIGGIIAIASVFFTWTSNGGLFSSFGRRVDESIAGESFIGLAASGGSWFAYLVLVFGLMVVAAALVTTFMPGKGPRFLTTDGALLASLAMLAVMASYLIAALITSTSAGIGIGVIVALVGGVVASVGSVLWIRQAAHTPLHPLSNKISWGRIVGAALASLIVIIGAMSSWSFDRRVDTSASDDILQRIQELEEEFAADPSQAGVITTEIASLQGELNKAVLIITDGIRQDGGRISFEEIDGERTRIVTPEPNHGSRLGVPAIIGGLIALLTILPASGLFGRDERRQWIWSTAAAGIGVGISAVAFSWIFVHVRSADPSYLSGIGSFLVLMGGAMLAATSVTILKEFRRTKIFADPEPTMPMEPAVASEESKQASEALV